MPTHSPRENDLRHTLESDDVALGILENTYSPMLVEFYGELGLDFVWIDLEHAGPSPFDGERLEALLRAADVSGTELLVRLPEPDPGWFGRRWTRGRGTCSSRVSSRLRRFGRPFRHRDSPTTANRGPAALPVRARVAGDWLRNTPRARMRKSSSG